MAYGVNAPFGLRPLCSIDGGSWTEKVNEYYIFASTDGSTTYATPIFTGDPVAFTTAAANITGNPNVGGFIIRYTPTFTDAAPSTWAGQPILGVFMGCEYQSIINGTNNLIKSPYWPGSAQVVPGSLIKAYVCDARDVVYDIQISTHCNRTVGNTFSASPTFPNINATAALAGGFGSNFALNIGGGIDFNLVVNSYTQATQTTYANNPASGSTLTGQSAFYLDVSTGATTANPPVIDPTHDYNKTLATLPLKVIGWTEDPRNIAAPTLTRATTPFLNVRVLINSLAYGNNTVGALLA